ncbi:MAG: hypothetical protein ACOC9A_02295 [Candidatus Bipolaricaulota bacterium]
MSKRRILAIGAIGFSLLILFTFLVTGDEVSGKLSQVITSRLGLSSDVYRVIETEYQGERVILIAIYGSDRALDSSLGEDIKSGLQENMDESPIALSVLTRKKDAKFHPYAVRVLQGDEKKRPKNMIGITEGFKDGQMPEKVPIEDEVFWGSKGIITLGDGFDASSPFKVKYGSSSADFSLGDEVIRQEEKVTEEKEVTEEKPETGESGLKAAEPKTESRGEDSSSDSETPSDSGQNSAVSDSRTGQGATLLASLATLLSITLSFL